MIETLSRLAQADPTLESAVKNLAESEILLREAGYELNHYLNHTDMDSALLAHAEQRLSDWHGTARKLRILPEALPAEYAKLKAELQSLNETQDLDALHTALLTARTRYEQVAARLSTERKLAARKLADKVTESMQTLNMQGGRFEIGLGSAAPSSKGSDTVEFLVAGHPGVTPQPVSKVASGGELARISLAITVNTVENTPVPTLIFDEVDSGIGGAVAETVGKYLRQLATNKQVLCVTHLPQVAAQGHHHYQVSKVIEQGHTRSCIVALSTEARVQEIARMLGGVSISESHTDCGQRTDWRGCLVKQAAYFDFLFLHFTLVQLPYRAKAWSASSKP
ncbi:MAG: hypothetical protein HC848_01515 [Limnobacter sp.]|nr:hypothetical protein [Limnobacter sp.]